jgi:hypothetical protein
MNLPGTSLWQRAGIWFLSLLPIEWLLRSVPHGSGHSRGASSRSFTRAVMASIGRFPGKLIPAGTEVAALNGRSRSGQRLARHIAPEHFAIASSHASAKGERMEARTPNGYAAR